MSVWWEMLAVAIGGAFGSVSRFGLSRWVQGLMSEVYFPWGIFVCNVLGCLLIGIMYGVLVHRMSVGPLWRAGLLIGVLGGFTTFSSFSLDTLNLFLQGDYFLGLSNIFFTVTICLLATTGGMWMAIR